MKTIKADWEIRNLGVTCTEIIVSANDTVEELECALRSHQSCYTVIKLPVLKTDFHFCLTQHGFTFIEALYNVTKKVSDHVLSPIQARMSSEVIVNEMTIEGEEYLYSEIRRGMFDSDRVALDPQFSKSQSAERYINWIADEKNKGATIHELNYRSSRIGFFTMKQLADGSYYPFLAGLYGRFAQSGLGFNTVYQPIRFVKHNGGDYISTWISTNNIKAVRLHSMMQFEFKSLSYVFVKHADTT